MNFNELFNSDRNRREALATAYVFPDQTRCVQCGICSYNCPQGIDVRRYAWLGEPVRDSNCLTCGECVIRCPRGALCFEQTHLFKGEAVHAE